MQIQPIQNNNLHNSKPNFKASYPVVHWVAETNSSYAPVISLELTKKLHRALVSLFNKTNKLSKTAHGQDLITKLAKTDMDYRRNAVTRSFYNHKGGFRENRFIPISYLLTGEDAKKFSFDYGRPLGKAISSSPRVKGERYSAELNLAVREYALGGLDFVKSPNKKIYDTEGVELALHTKFQTIRSKTGKVKGYELIDIKFCPTKGPENPFVKTGILKK